MPPRRMRVRTALPHTPSWIMASRSARLAPFPCYRRLDKRPRSDIAVPTARRRLHPRIRQASTAQLHSAGQRGDKAVDALAGLGEPGVAVGEADAYELRCAGPESPGV